jgi:elongation factor G
MSYNTNKIRNIVLLGHAGSGKTTLAETMLFESGTIHRMGSVQQGTTTSDYHDIEKEKQKSVYSSVMALDWRGYRINLIDTPGTADYVGDVVGSLKVAATAVFVVDAETGVEVGTDRMWRYAMKYDKPSLFVVNKMDKENADFDKSVEGIQEHFGRESVVVQYPLNEGIGFNSIIDVLKMTMYKFPEGGGKPEKLPIPDGEKEKAERLHNELIESIAENDESLMERYFEQGSLDEDEMREGLRISMVKHQLFPIFCISSVQNMGTGRLMGFIDNVAPSPLDIKDPLQTDGTPWKVDPDGPTMIYAFKDHLEAHIGDLIYFKVYNGTVKSGMDLVNQTTGGTNRISSMFVTAGSKRTEVQELKAGDIGAVVKLKDVNIGNTLCEKGLDCAIEPIHFPDPVIDMAISPKTEGDEEKLAQALTQLHREDPSLMFEHNAELRQMIIHAQGEEHLRVAEYHLKERYGIEVEFTQPRIAYRETITTSAKAQYKHRKQSGGAGQYGEVFLQIDPWTYNMPDPDEMNVRGREFIDLEHGGKLVFLNCITGGVIDNRFLPAILKGIMEVMDNGPLINGYVRDVRVAVYDGSMHPVDSNDAAFKMAGFRAFKEAFLKAKPKLLEPFYEIEILVPQEYMGDIFGDLNTRRAQILGMDQEGTFQKIKALVPVAELHGYASYIKSASQGKASFKKSFHSYEMVPKEIQKSVVNENSDDE